MLGHEAQYAPSFTEAEWLLNLFPFDLALLDFDMPQMTGPMIAAKLAQRFPKIHPVIMSAHAPDHRRKEEIGNWPFLQKPLSRQKLQTFLDDFLRAQGGSSLMLRASFPILRVSDEMTHDDIPNDE